MDAGQNLGEQQLAVLRATMSYDLCLRLINLLKETHYSLVQRNGQRIYGPPPNWQGARPPRGCEVFVGRLPRDAFEDELIPIFSCAGKIYEMRLMMEFSGYTRGFCFVVYANKYGAYRAVRMLHLMEIRANYKITVYRSLDNSRLFVGGIPYDKTKEEIWKAFSDILIGISDIIVYRNPDVTKKNRGYVFVDFMTHRHAMEARKKLWPSRLVVWGAQLRAEWAVPVSIESNLRKLYIANLSPFLGKEELTRIILEKTGIANNSVVHVFRRYNHAIVQFTTQQSAQAAMTALTGITIAGNKIEVQRMRCQRVGGNAQQNWNRHPRGNCKEIRQGNGRHKAYAPRPENANQSAPSNSLDRGSLQSSQETPSDSTTVQVAVVTGDPLYKSSQSQPLLPQICEYPSDGGLANLQLCPRYCLPEPPLPHNAFAMNSLFQPLVASSPLQVPMLNSHSEISQLQFDDRFRPANADGPLAEMYVIPPQHLQYVDVNFNDNGNSLRTNPYFVPISYDGAAVGMRNDNEDDVYQRYIYEVQQS